MDINLKISLNLWFLKNRALGLGCIHRNVLKSCTAHTEIELLTILVQSQSLGRSAGSSSNSQQTGHYKPVKRCQLVRNKHLTQYLTDLIQERAYLSTI